MTEKTEQQYYEEANELAKRLVVAITQGRKSLSDKLAAELNAMHQELATNLNVFLPPFPDAPIPAGKISFPDWLKKMARRKKN